MGNRTLATVLERSPKVHRNLGVASLIEQAVSRKEGLLTDEGALTVTTGKYTGRSPKDKFVVVEPSVKEHVNWGSVNQPMEPAVFDRLFAKVAEHLAQKELFVFDGFAGADPAHRLSIRVVNEYAWQNLFVHQLFVRPTDEELKTHEAAFTVVCAPSFHANPAVDGTNSEAFICLSFEKRIVLIGGTQYAGEMKKSIFTVMNYLLPMKGILSMHCSANIGQRGDVTLFFGLSGTGKTTLSADPNRRLIGDDEHGWTDEGVFNIEGGCYAKCIKLSKEHEPQIWSAIRFGSVLENVVVDPETRVPNYDSDKLTENTRAAYPVDFIPNAVIPGVGGMPEVVVFLTADAFGVLPPISKLTKEQAMYHFISGYTSKLAGTERGVVSPEATFSSCFGGPFLPLPPAAYAKLLGEKIEKHNTKVYLLNTGWSGGPYGVGKRMSLPYTRAMVDAALNGALDKVEFVQDPIFQVLVPTSCPNVPADVLQPRKTWTDPEAYDAQARKLAELFAKNIAKFDVPQEIRDAGPRT
ncbi:MAG TPA: phosphoenolpyruvate carboxykinase (ATP) [Symbiobacteriaceae bacterium]|nr:phosphoenolpyruvate carboxykinase (ATP) [Symbiobacteriaceae bacterium]